MLPYTNSSATSTQTVCVPVEERFQDFLLHFLHRRFILHTLLCTTILVRYSSNTVVLLDQKFLFSFAFYNVFSTRVYLYIFCVLSPGHG